MSHGHWIKRKKKPNEARPMTNKDYAQLIANGLTLAIPEGHAIVIYTGETRQGFGIVSHRVNKEHVIGIIEAALDGLKTGSPKEEGPLEP